MTHKGYKVGFVVSGIVYCGLLGLQAYRSNAVRDENYGLLLSIEKNTKAPRSVQVTLSKTDRAGAIYTESGDRVLLKDIQKGVTYYACDARMDCYSVSGTAIREAYEALDPARSGRMNSAR